jgi:hypothetical protein
MRPPRRGATEVGVQAASRTRGAGWRVQDKAPRRTGMSAAARLALPCWSATIGAGDPGPRTKPRRRLGLDPARGQRSVRVQHPRWLRWAEGGLPVGAGAATTE